MRSSSNSNNCNRNIKMVEAELAPGFRFHPRDDELVCDYLMKKLAQSHQPILLIQVDLNKCEPWDLPEVACVGGKDWYFYSQRDRKYATGVRTNRATISGYWKATGKDRAIHRKGSLVGMRKTLVFYQGRAPKGRKTEWVMHEFRLEGTSFDSPHKLTPLKEDWVLCRVFYKSRSEVSGQFQKQSNMGSNYNSSYDDDRVSSSLPPLMDSYITFDQTQPNLTDDYYARHPQVSCFSNIFSPSSSHQQYLQTVPSNNQNPNFNHHFEPSNHFGKNFPAAAAASSACLDPFDCEKKVIRAVLHQLTETDQSISSAPNYVNGNGSPPSSESYLSEVGMPPTNFWSPY